MKTTRKMKKSTCAICTAPPAIPVKPKSAATRAITKKMTAQVNMDESSSEGPPRGPVALPETYPPPGGGAASAVAEASGGRTRRHVQLVFHEKDLRATEGSRLACKVFDHKTLDDVAAPSEVM